MVQLVGVPLGGKGLEKFVKLPWQLYSELAHCTSEERANWRAPLRLELLGSRWLNNKGLLTKAHPYHEHADVMHWIAYDKKNAVGRISAAVNQRLLDKGQEFEGAGYLGFFESINDIGVARALVEEASAWVSERGCTRIMGPGGYSNATHEPYQGVLVEGFDSPPSVELMYNPPFYGLFFEELGFQKAVDYVTYDILLEDFIPIAEKRRKLFKRAYASVKDEGVVFRKLNMRNLERDVGEIIEVYNEAWKDNWGFLEISQPEGDVMAENLRDIADPEMLMFAEKNGEPVAVFGGIPDPYQINRPLWSWRFRNNELVRMIRTKVFKPKHLRVMFMGVVEGARKEPLVAAMFKELVENAISGGYATFDCSMLLEHNIDVINLSKGFGGKFSKRYRIFEKSL